MFENEVLETDNLVDLEVTERAIAAQSPPTSEVERQWDPVGGRPLSLEPFTGSELVAVGKALLMGTGPYDAAKAQEWEDNRMRIQEDPQGIHVVDIERTEALGNFERLNAEVTAAKKKRVKRTESQMIAALGGSALKEANYVADRVRKLEDKISELMGSVSPAARELVLKDNPHLSRY
ncbi:MAG TPA: hypothetical protein VIY48_01975 [Candidatus Paceibacterota bacterium]